MSDFSLPSDPKGKYTKSADPESIRLQEDAAKTKNWKRWGPYVSERQWGTVREDYSNDGNCWGYLSHDQARSRAYRWGEDGILGITDRECRLCFGLAMWNGKDPILKERLFGLTGPEANHGEDCKEEYFYISSTPTHSYMKGLYKYPQKEYPYNQLVHENQRRGKGDPEYELVDTGAFDEGRYFDVEAEYAKADENDMLIRINISNRGPEEAVYHFLPTFWYRNTWIWGCRHEGCWVKPTIKPSSTHPGRLDTTHVSLGDFVLAAETLEKDNKADVNQYLVQSPEWLFTDNETNTQRLFGVPSYTPFVKDAFHNYVIHGQKDAINSKERGTKVAAYHIIKIPAHSTVTLRLRFYSSNNVPSEAFGASFDKIFEQRIQEKDIFYNAVIPSTLTKEERNVAEQAYAGMLWSKQFYHYIVKDWLDGDPEQPPPPEERKHGRNADWQHVFNRDVISMPDKWEYPWFAAWDLAFHCVAFSYIDVEFAKQQLVLMLREWYMHPNGALPAYEFAFGDVNPPVHAWATWRVYKSSGPEGHRDVHFLARVFQKLLINFTWWVNRKDVSGKHIFAGGFLGLDNIGLFDRSKPLPNGGSLEQADGTAWMGSYCLYMLKIALELAQYDEVYEDVASKFFEHFVSIADAMNTVGGTGLWDEEDGFYHDQLHLTDQNKTIPMKIRSLVGIVPCFAVGNLTVGQLRKTTGFFKRTRWFLENRKDLAKQIAFLEASHCNSSLYLLAIPKQDRMERVLKYLFDEKEFLSDYGIRSISKYHKDHPYIVEFGADKYCVEYIPGESNSWLFGGNSNWRGPIWFPMNFLLIEALERFHNFYGPDYKVEFPTGSGNFINLDEASNELTKRLVKIFLPDEKGRRPTHGTNDLYATDPHWKNLPLFYEYFHGDTGKGLGASHQTGWTGLVACCLHTIGKRREAEAKRKENK